MSNKIHLIMEPRPFSRGRFYKTACGMEGALAPHSQTEFETAVGNRFEVAGVGENTNCARCKRSLNKANRP